MHILSSATSYVACLAQMVLWRIHEFSFQRNPLKTNTLCYIALRRWNFQTISFSVFQILCSYFRYFLKEKKSTWLFDVSTELTSHRRGKTTTVFKNYRWVVKSERWREVCKVANRDKWCGSFTIELRRYCVLESRHHRPLPSISRTQQTPMGSLVPIGFQVKTVQKCLQKCCIALSYLYIFFR